MTDTTTTDTLDTGCTYMGTALQACGCATVLGKSYCQEHIYLVYKQGTARAKRHKEIRTVDKVRIVEQLMHEAIAELEAEGFDVYGERELDLDESSLEF